MSGGQAAVLVTAWAGGGAALLAFLARWLYRIARDAWGSNDLEWPDAVVLAHMLLWIVATLAGLAAVVGYAFTLALGGLPLWSLAAPTLGLLYGARRFQRWAAEKRAER